MTHNLLTKEPHANVLDGLSRLTALVREHRDELPPLFVSVSPDGLASIQVPSALTFSEPVRRAAVDLIARVAHLPVATENGVNHYETHDESYRWQVYTPVKAVRNLCDACGKPVHT